MALAAPLLILGVRVARTNSSDAPFHPKRTRKVEA
jgi:hypothetical protein